LGAPTIAVVGSIGTAIGNLFGLSGIAATNFGLALLGGGSIVSGGFGIAGGTAILAAALSFGTDVTLDYAVGKASSRYQAAQFVRYSKSMMTLPVPVNTNGSESVEAAGKALESKTTSDAVTCARKFPDNLDTFKKCITDLQKTQRQRVRDAIKAMSGFKETSKMTGPDVERKYAMLATLHFLDNNYPAAGRAAERAYIQGLRGSRTPTLPAFVGAACMLYADQPNLVESYNRFNYSVTAEPDNPLTPILFAAYLDRLSYRLNDGAAGVPDLDRLRVLSQLLADDDRKLVIQQRLLNTYVMQVLVTQQRVLSLVRWEDRTPDEQRGDLSVVRASFRDHKQLLSTALGLVANQETLLKTLSRDGTWWERVKERKNPFGNEKTKREEFISEWDASLQKYKQALLAYREGQDDLSNAVAAYEKKILHPEVVTPDLHSTESDSTQLSPQ
jgi:hypothetical protein